MEEEFGRLGSVLEAGNGDGDGWVMVFQAREDLSPKFSVLYRVSRGSNV